MGEERAKENGKIEKAIYIFIWISDRRFQFMVTKSTSHCPSTKVREPWEKRNVTDFVEQRASISCSQGPESSKQRAH